MHFFEPITGTILILIEQVTEETQTQEKKRSQPHTDNTPSPKKKKVKTYEVDLPDAPIDGMFFFRLLLIQVLGMCIIFSILIKERNDIGLFIKYHSAYMIGIYFQELDLIVKKIIILKFHCIPMKIIKFKLY